MSGECAAVTQRIEASAALMDACLLLTGRTPAGPVSYLPPNIPERMVALLQQLNEIP